MTKWISVKDKLPDPMHLVILFFKSTDLVACSEKMIGALKPGLNSYWIDRENNILANLEYQNHALFNVTHWMPLPNSPEQEE